MLVVAMQGHISPWFFEMDRVAFEKEGLYGTKNPAL